MKLSFFPRPGMLCWDPERRPTHRGGQPAGYVGRKLSKAVKDGDGNVVTPAAYVAKDVPYEVFAASHSGRRLAKLCRRGELWPADRMTAAHCGVEFVELEQGEDKEWRPAKTKPKPQPERRSEKDD